MQSVRSFSKPEEVRGFDSGCFLCPNRTTGAPGPRRAGERPAWVREEGEVKVKVDVLRNPVISECDSKGEGTRMSKLCEVVAKARFHQCAFFFFSSKPVEMTKSQNVFVSLKASAKQPLLLKQITSRRSSSEQINESA